MTEEFLKEFGIPEEGIEKILAANQAELEALKLQYAIRSAVEAEKPKNLELALSLLDTEGLVFQDGKVIGLEERLAELKKAHPYLFAQEADMPRIVAPANSGKAGGINAAQFAQMGYRDRVQLYRQDPELYKALTGDE